MVLTQCIQFVPKKLLNVTYKWLLPMTVSWLDLSLLHGGLSPEGKFLVRRDVYGESDCLYLVGAQ